MPYRLDLDIDPAGAADALDRLVELGALDVEPLENGLAAIMPDGVAAARVARALGRGDAELRVTPARGRDDGSVWLVKPRPVQAGRFRIVPVDGDWPDASASRGLDATGLDASAPPEEVWTLLMTDGPAFGTGLHPTTALCLEMLDEELRVECPAWVLDVGTGSGVLALAALRAGVGHAVAIDIDADAVRVAAANARLNGLASRLALVHGGPEVLTGAWPLVLANVLAAPLIDMAPALSRRVGRSGRLLLSGIRESLATDVEQAYRRCGMRQIRTQAQDGWTALLLHASW